MMLQIQLIFTDKYLLRSKTADVRTVSPTFHKETTRKQIKTSGLKVFPVPRIPLLFSALECDEWTEKLIWIESHLCGILHILSFTMKKENSILSQMGLIKGEILPHNNPELLRSVLSLYSVLWRKRVSCKHTDSLYSYCRSV